MPDQSLELTIRVRRWIWLPIGIALGSELLFLLLDYHINYGKGSAITTVRTFCNLAREDSLSSWFGVTQTALIALTLWMIVVAVSSRSDATRFRRTGWIVLASFFSYMTADDGSKIHERFGTTFRVIGERGAEDGGWTVFSYFPSYSWQVVFLPTFAALGVFTLVFLWRELADNAGRWWVLAALSLFAAAVGLDFIEGLEQNHRWNVHHWITEWVDMREFTRYRFRKTPFETVVHFSKAIEETMEMMGNTVLWSVFLRYFTGVGDGLRLRLKED